MRKNLTLEHEGRLDSYFNSCKYCGEAIQLRQMEHGQWVAFDGYDRVHKCNQKSSFKSSSSNKSRRINRNHKTHTAEVRSSVDERDLQLPKATKRWVRFKENYPLSLGAFLLILPLMIIFLPFLLIAKIGKSTYRYLWLSIIFYVIYLFVRK